jgi:hypothetical protein
MTARVVLITGAVAREREISFGSLSVKSAIVPRAALAYAAPQSRRY